MCVTEKAGKESGSRLQGGMNEQSHLHSSQGINGGRWGRVTPRLTGGRGGGSGFWLQSLGCRERVEDSPPHMHSASWAPSWLQGLSPSTSRALRVSPHAGGCLGHRNKCCSGDKVLELGKPPPHQLVPRSTAG